MNPSIFPFDQVDVDNLALVAWKEARGEGLYSCQAVMHVCKNRVGKTGFAHTLHDVIYGRNQFTSMSVPSDPQYNLKPEDADPVYTSLLHIAPQVLDGTLLDITNSALYYENPETAQKGGWFERVIVDHPETYEVCAEIKHHVFYRPVQPLQPKEIETNASDVARAAEGGEA